MEILAAENKNRQLEDLPQAAPTSAVYLEDFLCR